VLAPCRVLWAALVGGSTLALPAFGLPEPLSGQWEGELVLHGQLELYEATLTFTAPLGPWTLTSESEFEHGLFSNQTFELQGFAFDYRLTWESKAVFSPTEKVLKRLYRTAGGISYDQLLWQAPGPHWRYGWLKGEFPLPSGELWAKAYHRCNSSSDIDYFMFTDAYRWDAGAGCWRPLGDLSAGVRERAFIAGKVRLTALVDGSWRSRTEYNLRALLVPGAASEPFVLAPEAVRYLDAKYPDGWSLREPIDPELVKVYVWYSHYEEYTLGWESEPWPGRTLELAAVFSGLGGGVGFAEVSAEAEGWYLCGGMGELELSLEPENGPMLSASLEGLPGPAGFKFDLSLDLSLSELALSLTPSWSGPGGCVSLHAGLAGGWGISELCLYGVEAQGHLAATEWEALLVFSRPPSPRPSWYTRAEFKKIVAIGEYEDGRLALIRKGYTPKGKYELSFCAYLGPASGSLFSITRFLVMVEFSLTGGASWEISWESRDPESPAASASLALCWELDF